MPPLTRPCHRPCAASPGWLLPLLGLLGCSDQKIGVVHDPPIVTVTAPSAGTEFYEGQTVRFQALVEPGTSGEDVTSITHSWVSGNETLCEDEPVNADGYAECSWAFSETGLQTVEVTVVDSRRDRAKASTEVQIIDNTPPEVEILAPEAESYFATDELVELVALVSDAEQDPQEMDVSVESSLDGELSTSAHPASSGDLHVGLNFTTPGEHLVTLRVYDSYGQSAQDTVMLNIYEHGPPRADSVNITPSPADTLDTLTAEVQGWVDLDGFPERYRYAWYYYDDASGLMVQDTGETTATYPAAKTERGDLYQVVVTPYNDYGNGTPLSSPTIEIVNSPPSEPIISITPPNPQPFNNLQCVVDGASTDADDDPITYLYEWYKNGVLTTNTTNVVSSSDTAHGDTWECVVTPFDGEDEGISASASVSVFDGTAPPPPVIDTPYRYRNDDSVTLTGDCEAGCALTMYCADSSVSWTDSMTCDSTGAFSYTTLLSRGDTTSCYADCEDSAGNISPSSNTVSTEVCDPWDEYEDSSGYGDAGADSIDEWAVLADTGTSTISVEANILGSDSEDWYVISTSDDIATDLAAGLDYYKFSVDMVAGTSDYSFLVYKGSSDATDMECSASYSTTGYTEYDDFSQDKGDGSHAVPSDTRSCGNGSSAYNNCEDQSEVYYIKVFRRSTSITSCQHYELEITNGVW